MCKEFDEEFFQPTRDDAKLYRTIYLVFYMLACKEGYFQNNFKYYDEFAQFAATTIYIRFLRKYARGERVKSLLNYAKASLDKLKIMFQNEAFETIITPKQCNTENLSAKIQTAIRSDYREGLEEDVASTLSDVDNVIRDILDDFSIEYDELTKHRLYMSTLLTFLNSIVLPRDLRTQLNKSKKNLDDSLFIEALTKERDKPPILWNLDSSMSNVVRLVVNRLRKDLSENINDRIKEHTLPDDVVELIIANAYSEGRLCPEKEEDYD